jgi:ferredoxin
MRTTHWVDGVQQPIGHAQEVWKFWAADDTPEHFLARVAAYRAVPLEDVEDADIGCAVEDYIDDAWPERRARYEMYLSYALRDARDKVRHACAYCGTCIGDSPASDDPAAWPERNPPVGDDAAWARIAAAHRPGCEWVATRAHRVVPGTPVVPPGDEVLHDDAPPVVEKPDSIRWSAIHAILAAIPDRTADLRRFERGLMPDDEQREILLDAALAPLARWDRFTRLLRGDVPHGSPCRIPLIAPHTDGECTFEEIPKPSLTAAEFAALEGIEAALARKDDDPLPWAIAIAPFALVATCTACGATRTRAGIAVTVRVGDWTLERRYAAEVPPGWRQEG